MGHLLFPLLVFLFPLAYSPGPGNMFFAANGARFGLRATLPASAGYHLATWTVTAGIGAGLISAFADHPQLFTTIRIAGSLYVLWIAWKLFRSGRVEGRDSARPAGFRDGAMLLILNPKAYVIITLMFTQFLSPGAGDSTATILLITSIFTLNNFIAFVFWTLAGAKIAQIFVQDKSARQVNRVFGVMLAAVALWMLVL